jgi:hypothetical protein
MLSWLLAVDRETAIVIAFSAIIVAGVVVSVGAWILLRREVRRSRVTTAGGADEPVEPVRPAQT